MGPTSPNLEVREEILGTQMDDEGSEGPWLVEGIVDEETPCRREDREALAPPLQGWGGGVNEREGHAVNRNALKLTLKTSNTNPSDNERAKKR